MGVTSVGAWPQTLGWSPRRPLIGKSSCNDAVGDICIYRNSHGVYSNTQDNPQASIRYDDVTVNPEFREETWGWQGFAPGSGSGSPFNVAV